MRIIGDFHLHSKYSRATSAKMDLSHIAEWSTRKGIDIVGTADFTHPQWLNEIRLNLKEDGSGFLRYQKSNVRFVLSSEISSIYKDKGKTRKIHTLVLVPDLKTAINIHQALAKVGNVFSDGRPILGLSAKKLAQLVLDINPKSLIIPAHAWTPWFSIFGSRSGYDAIEECYEELTDKIYAIETGLSSDPEMNWRLSALDNITLISNSDAHSGPNLMREANVFNLDSDKISYAEIYDTIKNKDNKRLISTLEFFPEEGKYHFDGHEKCKLVIDPFKQQYPNDICPICKRPLTIGVAHRVEELADRSESKKLSSFPASIHLVPLQEIIASSLKVGKQSKKVWEKYLEMTRTTSEISILLDKGIEEITKISNAKIAEGVKRMREGKVQIDPGYDGVYGKVRIFPEETGRQKTLF